MTDDTQKKLLLAVASLSLHPPGTQAHVWAQLQVRELLEKARHETNNPPESR